jgi:hypothetical protein
VENSIYIHKDWQKKKLGTLLLRHLITVSEQLGYHAIIAGAREKTKRRVFCILKWFPLGLTEGNDGSERLHEQFGFKKVARFEEIGYKVKLQINLIQLFNYISLFFHFLRATNKILLRIFHRFFRFLSFLKKSWLNLIDLV